MKFHQEITKAKVALPTQDLYYQLYYINEHFFEQQQETSIKQPQDHNVRKEEEIERIVSNKRDNPIVNERNHIVQEYSSHHRTEESQKEGTSMMNDHQGVVNRSIHESIHSKVEQESSKNQTNKRDQRGANEMNNDQNNIRMNSNEIIKSEKEFNFKKAPQKGFTFEKSHHSEINENSQKVPHIENNQQNDFFGDESSNSKKLNNNTEIAWSFQNTDNQEREMRSEAAVKQDFWDFGNKEDHKIKITESKAEVDQFSYDNNHQKKEVFFFHLERRPFTEN